MDLNEQLKGWLHQQAQPGSFLDKAGLGLAQAGQTLGQDAAAGASIMNDPRNSWIGMNPLGRVAAEGLGLLGMLKPFYHGTTMNNASAIMNNGFDLAQFGKGADRRYLEGGGPVGWYGKGVYLADRPMDAEGYAKQAQAFTEEATKKPQGRAILSTELDTDHLLDMQDPQAMMKAADEMSQHFGIPADDILLMHMTDFNGLAAEYAKAKGMKGLRIGNETVVFDPANVGPVKLEKYEVGPETYIEGLKWHNKGLGVAP